MNYLRPTYCVDSVANIDAERLLALHPNLQGVAWDLDGNLADHNGDTVSPGNLETLVAFDGLGMRQGLISNAGEARTPRAREIGDKANRSLDRDLLVMTSNMFYGLGKPLPVMFKLWSRMMGIAPENLAYVGDQLTKDILGANLAGYCCSILVAYHGQTKNKSNRLLFTPADTALRVSMGLPPRPEDFPPTLTDTSVRV